jgi:uncharacterized membrane protein YfcA
VGLTPTLVVRRRDANPVRTWMALTGLVAALGLAALGLPHADIHGPLHYLGVMDPFCGATRSVYLTMHGQLAEAVRYNPAGPLLLAAAVAVLMRAAIGWVTGYWVGARVPKRILTPVVVIAVIALEINQQLEAALLMQPWGAT